MDRQSSGGRGGFGWILALGGAAAVALVTGGTSRFLTRFLKVAGFGLAGLLFLLAAVLVIALLVSRHSEGEKLASTDREAVGMAHKSLTALRLQGSRVQDGEIRTENNELCGTFESLLTVLKEKPDHISGCQPFLDYYLGAQKKLLDSCAEAEKNGGAAPVRDKVLAHMQTIEAALEEQKAALADDVLLDLSAEMEVMARALQRDGLG